MNASDTVLHCRTLDVTLDLKDPQYPDDNLGTLDLSVTLSPKEGDVRDAVRKSSIIIFFICLLQTHITPDMMKLEQKCST